MNDEKEACQGGSEFAHWIYRRRGKSYQFVVDNTDDPMQICDYFSRLAQEYAAEREQSAKAQERKTMVSHLCYWIDSRMESSGDDLSDHARDQLISIQQHIVERFPDLSTKIKETQ